MHDGAFEQLITNLERAGAPYSLPDDWILCLDDDVLRDLRRGERRKWLRRAKAEALRRNLQNRVDEIAEAAENEGSDFAEVLIEAFREDSKNFPELSASQRRRWIEIATAAMHRSDDGPCIYFIGPETRNS
ncbi:MAG: hypothetical protein AB7G54_07065 [Methyloceanibacter sp.]